jgi:GH24 family phage-related lysozyme (muramidase)
MAAMKMSEEGLALIREFEGFRATAYRDAVGVWTIGFGHTAMAGPPDVTAGQRITRAEAEEILAQDVSRFAGDVARMIRVPLTDAQFSALVSFAYNVGPGAFRGSSVLKAVNSGDFAAVPRRLALWTRAGGRVLPGLIRRRAAEAALFASVDTKPGLPGTNPGEPPDPVTGPAPARSKTVIAALLAMAAAIVQALVPLRGTILAFLFLVVVAAAAAFIIRERIRKAKEDGI